MCDDGGDVVRPARGVSALHQLRSRLLRRKGPEDRADLGAREQPVKAVAGQEYHVTLAYLDRRTINLDAVEYAQGAREHVSTRVSRRLLLRDQAAADAIGDPCVVAGQERQLAIAKEVGPAIAHVCEG